MTPLLLAAAADYADYYAFYHAYTRTLRLCLRLRLPCRYRRFSLLPAAVTLSMPFRHTLMAPLYMPFHYAMPLFAISLFSLQLIRHLRLLMR